MLDLDLSSFPRSLQKKIEVIYTDLSVNGKITMQQLLEDSLEHIEKGFQKAIMNNPNIEKEIVQLLLRKKIKIIQDIEQEESKDKGDKELQYLS